MTASGKAVQARGLTEFLLIAFLLPLPAMAVQEVAGSAALRFVFFGIQAAAPSIAAITVLAVHGDGKAYFWQTLHCRHLWKAVIFPLVTACVTMFLAKAAFCLFFGGQALLGTVTPVQFLTIAWTFVAEELGWRGYLESQLNVRNLPGWLVPAVVGVIWGAWHYHYFLSGRIQVPVPLFFAGCIAESFLYSFFMVCTGNNLCSVMTYHFAWNLFFHVFALGPEDNGGTIVPYAIMVVLEGCLLLALVCRQKRRGGSGCF